MTDVGSSPLVLSALAFNTSGVKGKTLQDILQDEKIPKGFSDSLGRGTKADTVTHGEFRD
jgi:hypothetical protein